ncbi:MAG: carboxypeptidase regulatory-like domain-containing protein [Terriglobales bacterium]
MIRPTVRVLIQVMLSLMLSAGAAWAQNATTGAISGKVTDPSGASVPAATVLAINLQTGGAYRAVTQPNGGYIIPLLQPGSYTVTVTHPGFSTAKQVAVAVAVTSNIGLNFKLAIGQTSQTVEVTGQAPLLQPENPNISTTLNAQAIENLPNPGNDLTYLAQLTPGATITKNGSYYNATYNGLPGTTSNFTIDGGSYNDPYLGINNSGPTNLSMGANDISEVTVATNPYSVDQGHSEGANVNYVSKHGTNSWHGNLSEQWNGRVLNAYDTFQKMTSPVGPKPFDNVNFYTGSVGGPIAHSKVFFFVDDEGARIDLPVVDTGVLMPTAGYEQYAKQQLLVGGCETDPTYFNPTSGGGTAPATGNCAVSGATQPGVASGENGNYLYLPPQPQEAAFQSHELSLYKINNPALQSTPYPMFGCNLLPNGSLDATFNPQVAGGQAKGDANFIPTDSGCANQVTFSGSNLTWENKLITRVDWHPGENNTFWFSYTNDRGLQATGLSAINPIFNQDSFQPEWGTNGDWTHIFSPDVVNDLSFSQLWYSAPFEYADQSVVDAVQPLRFNTPWDTLGSTSFPQGRNVTNFGVIDNLSIVKGSHQFRVGVNFLREWITDYDFEGSEKPNISAGSLAEFDYGVAPDASISVPVNPDQPVRIYSIEAYAGDTWQMSRNFTFIYGVRLTNNSNPHDPAGVLGNPQDWELMTHSLGISPANVIGPSNKLFSHVPFVFAQPRLAFSWQPWQNTLVTGGWGMFEAVAPADAIDNMARNAPFDPSYNGGYDQGDLGTIPTDGTGTGPSAAGCPFEVLGAGAGNPQCYALYDPSQANSVVSAMGTANQLFQSNFAAKAPSCTAPGAPPTACVPVQRLTIQPQQGLSAPYADEWSFGIERQLGQSISVKANYVGNRSYHNEDTVDPNSYQNLCSGCFAPFYYSAAGVTPDARFTSISQDRYDGYTTYNGLQLGSTWRSYHGFTLGLNYAWAHALQTNAPFLDSIPVSETYRDQSGTPFNVLSANYTYALPWHVHGSALLGQIVNGWQISGSTFSQGGDPIFVGSPSLNILHNGTGPDNTAYYLTGVSPYSRNTPVAGTEAGNYQWLNPAAFASVYNSHGKQCLVPGTTTYAPASAANCQFPGTYAFHLMGPGFQWTNLFLTKTFPLTERMNFRFDVQTYNVFNHPNYANPSTSGGVIKAAIPGVSSSFVNMGTINSLDAPSTSLLGNGLGGDSAPRMIAFEGEIIF